MDEVINQCKFALMSWEYLQASLWEKEVSNTRIFCHIQAFLVAVSNISKILYPFKKKFASRGAELRELLFVSEDSAIKDRKFRNDFEHYDERIECWASSSEKKNISDMNISVGGFSAIPSLDSIDCMRNLDLSRNRKKLTLTFNNELYNLNIIKNLVIKLQEKAITLRPSLF